MRYYVYELKDPFTDTVFYVGKGSNDRMFIHEKKILRGEDTHNKHLDNKIRKIHRNEGSVVCEKVFQSDNEANVLQQEILLIENIGLKNLCNMQGGGDGRSPDEETRKKISENRKGIPVSEETKRRMSEAKTGTIQTEETKRKKSLALKGKPQSPKQKAANKKRSAAMKGRKLSDEHKMKLRKAKLTNPTKYWEGKKIPNEMKQKISESLKRTLRGNKDE